MPDSVPAKNPLWYSTTKENLFSTLQTTDAGLSDAESKKRLEKFGPNTLTAKKKISPWSMYLSQFKNTLTLILIGSALLILFIYYFGEKDSSDLVEAALILGIVFMISILGFVQEFKAEKAIESLKKLMSYKAKVRRGGIEKEIAVSDLVSGDIVIIEEGLKVPADIRLLEVSALMVNEASLTGESVPISKAAVELDGEKSLSDQTNMLFAGTAVSSGRAIGVVVQTGDATEIGKIARDVANTIDESTPIQKRLDDIGKIIGYIILAISSVVFVFILFFAKEFADLTLLQRVIHSFIAAVALAVAAIPEGLPAVVTISLALGTQRMLKRNALVRKLNSVETLGSTDTICSDKTGTLTKGEMTVTKVYSDGEIYMVSGTGYEMKGDFSKNNKPIDPSKLTSLLSIGAVCNNAVLEKDGTILGDPTEAALLVSAAKAGITPVGNRVMEIPFSSERKMMSVILKDEKGYVLYTKGAPEVLVKVSKLTTEEKKTILQMDHDLSAEALRNLGFAFKKLSEKEYHTLKDSPEKLEDGLTFAGMQCMIDPPRIEVKPLIETCTKTGIKVIMITGDNIATAQAIAREIGIEGEAVTGEQLEKLSDKEFEKMVDTVRVYARMNPSFKMRVVEALKKKGHIVAMTGDGVNDAPALKKADIGIAMGITGTDVSKEASDMVLLDDKFSTIVASIEEGRGIFHNIRKFVSYLLSCNIAEVIVVFFGVILFQKLPLTATMLLWINVVTDGIPAVALGLDPAERGIMRYKPHVFQTQIILKRMWVEMIICGILLAIAVLGLFSIDLPKGLDYAEGAAFTAIVMYELVTIYLIRSSYQTSFFSNPWLLFSIAVTFALQLVILYVPFFANIFGIDPIDWIDWLYIFATSGLYWLIMKGVQSILNKIPALQEN